MSQFTTANDSADFLSQDTTSTAVENPTTKRHLLLKVPDYEHSGDTSTRNLSPPTWEPRTSKKNSLLAMGDADAFTSGLSSTNGNDLLAEQLQWIDDTRHRGTAADNGNDFASAKMATPPNETASRVEGALFQTANPAASIAIKDYVGWRDHTDGHRITTTRGDKIEVVGGNYKVVSYGRGQGDAVFEMSGGLIVDGDIAPGDVTSVTWRDCPTDSGNKGWKTVEQAQKANQVERFHGTKREEHFGDEIISVIGAPTGLASAAVTATSNNGEAETYLGGGAAAQTKGIHTSSGPGASQTLNSKAYPTKWDKQDDEPPALSQPHIYESTWAASMTSYTEVAGKSTTHEVYNDNVFSMTKLTGFGENYTEEWRLGGSGGFFEVFWGACTSSFQGSRQETFLGTAWELFLGTSTTIGLANRFELFAGAEEQLNIGFMLEISVGKKLEISAGPKTELETSSFNIRLAQEDTSIADLETKLSQLKTSVKDAKLVVYEQGTNVVKKTSGLSIQLG